MRKRWLMLVASIVFPVLAQAKVECSSRRACSVNRMPIYNQNSSSLIGDWGISTGGTNLCLPTSASMIFLSIVKGGLSPASQTSLAAFSNMKSQDDQIPFVARLMNTERKAGTTWTNGIRVIDDLAEQFRTPLETNFVTNSKTLALSSSQILSDLKNGRAPLLIFGHYYANCRAMVNGTKRCIYSRAGGHAMAVKGVAQSKVTFFDPWGGVAADRTFMVLPKTGAGGQRLEHVLPSLFSVDTAQIIRSEATYYALVEYTGAVGGRRNLSSRADQE